MKILSWAYHPKQGVLVDSPRLTRVAVRHGWGFCVWTRHYVGRNKTWYVDDGTLFWSRASSRMSRKLTRYFETTILSEGYTP